MTRVIFPRADWIRIIYLEGRFDGDLFGKEPIFATIPIVYGSSLLTLVKYRYKI